MEGLNSLHTHLENLHHQARTLTSTCLSLIVLFDQEANRLDREDEASRLKTLYSSIRQQVDTAKRNEDSASYGQNQADLTFSFIKLAVGGTIKMIAKDKKLSAFSDSLLTGPAEKQRPFGNVLVCIGPLGLPDDVRVVSISKSARQSNRPESEVINELQKSGCLLFNEKAFSLLIDRLVDDIRERRLSLPIPRDTLSQVTLLSKLKISPKKVE
jgi:hypothetical protein